MSTRFQGRISQIAGDLVQVWDVASGHSLYLERTQIEHGDEIRLNDEVLVEGDGSHRHARRLTKEPEIGLAAAN